MTSTFLQNNSLRFEALPRSTGSSSMTDISTKLKRQAIITQKEQTNKKHHEEEDQIVKEVEENLKNIDINAKDRPSRTPNTQQASSYHHQAEGQAADCKPSNAEATDTMIQNTCKEFYHNLQYPDLLLLYHQASLVNSPGTNSDENFSIQTA
jgi:hypothetical protein